ncbi:caspase family protein [Paraburkholderia caribensis]|uniref:caspase family protein n=1 Tax=Paraburkholderia caribensis TaxID=75105 RepID=UPI0031D8BC63
MRKALVVGVDDYVGNPLDGCVNDAYRLSAALHTNGDGSPNFDVRTITSPPHAIDKSQLLEAIETLFTGDADVALFYFAGHGQMESSTDEGFLVTPDHKPKDPGISLSTVLNLANRAQNIRARIIVLDSCYSGGLGQVPIMQRPEMSTISEGVTILAACRQSEGAEEENGAGVFTSLVVDALNGGAADLCGNISPGSIYAYVDQALGPWEQRPVFKTNVSRFTSLRSVPAKVPLETLRKLPTFFPEPESHFDLDPSYEHTTKEGVSEHQVTFRELQNCNRVGLVVPEGAQDMYWAAVESKACRLTALGYHYWRLAKKGRI